MNVTIREPRKNAPQHSEPFSTVPFLPDPDFIERPDVAAWLYDALLPPGSRAALVGLGGVGKSQVAIQYAYKTQKQSPSTYIFWVHASTRARFEEAYRNIADRVRLPRRHDPNEDVLRLVYNWLFNADNGQWLMILDNADDIDVFYPKNGDRTATVASTQRPLASLLPQSNNGRILLTSRSRNVAERLVGSWSVLPITPMEVSQALQLLEKKLRDKYEKEVAASLVGALEYLPLAIMQAAAYILRQWPRTSSSTYLEEFRKSEKKKKSLLNKEYGDLRRDAEAANSVVLTWQITFEQIQKERPSAAKLLSILSLFNPQGIPEWIVQSYHRRMRREERCFEEGRGGEDDSNEMDDDDDDDDDELDNDLETLLGYSLVAITTQKVTYEMHALVQLCTRVWLSSRDDIQSWKYRFLRMMSKEYPSGKYENWPKCQQLEPHIAHIIEMETIDMEGSGDWAQLLTNAGWYGWQMGRYNAAKAMLKKAVNVRERILGEEHGDTLLSISCMALVLQYQGKYEEAEQMNRRALDGREKALGQGHPSTLTSVSNLALVLGQQGKYEEAEQMTRRALNGREKALGQNHPDTLTSVSNLALVLGQQGKYEEAEQMTRRALNGREKALGKDHPSTLTSIYNLAYLYQRQHRLDEADELYLTALSGDRKVLGPTHPTTLACKGHHASLRE